MMIHMRRRVYKKNGVEKQRCDLRRQLLYVWSSNLFLLVYLRIINHTLSAK